ncbi:MAG: hypothetical protein O0W85_01660, partial [Methanocorpusculum sp.]|nr:hypothetical protein [Methanocorpusculum sp.]
LNEDSIMKNNYTRKSRKTAKALSKNSKKCNSKKSPLNILPNSIQKYAESSRILHQTHFTDQRRPPNRITKTPKNTQIKYNKSNHMKLNPSPQTNLESYQTKTPQKREEKLQPRT